MKRLVLSTIALSMLALPVAQALAGQRYDAPRYERQDSTSKPGFDNKVIVKKNVVKKTRWVRGERVPSWAAQAGGPRL